VASLELDAGGFLGGMEAAIEAAQALSGHARGASAGIARLSGAMGALKGAAEAGAGGAAEALHGLNAVGREAVNGMIAGAASRRGALVSAFQSLARAAVKAARDELGIASPSKVFQEIGLNAAKGFQLGVDRGAAGAQEAMRRLSSVGVSYYAGAPAARGAAAGVVNNHYAAPVSVTFPGAVVRNDNDIREMDRRAQRMARDLQYGLGARG
jgi:hypothetical protein